MGQAIAMATISRLMFITEQKFFRSVVIAFYEVRFKFRYNIMIFFQWQFESTSSLGIKH